MPTLVLSPRDTADAFALGAAALDAGWQVERLPTWRAPARLRGDDLVLYGEPLFIDVVCPALGLAVLEVPWDWTTTLPDVHRQRAIEFMTLGAARARATAAFVKPTEDKSFAAKVYASGALLAAATALLPETTPVLVAEPVQWEIEYRCFVSERQLLAYAPYLRDGEPLKDDAGNWLASTEASDEAVRYARTVLADSRVALPAGIVLDVGRIQGRGWAVVEANGAWGSGICGCAPTDVLPVLARATRPVAALTPNDARWTRTRYEVE